jgi:hypothetical protein
MDGAALAVDALRGALVERQAAVDVQAEAMRAQPAGIKAGVDAEF